MNTPQRMKGGEDDKRQTTSYWTFDVSRIMDVFAPGPGVLLDLVNALELINALQSSGELTGSDALDLARAAKTLHDRRQEIRSGIILARIRRCGLCRQMGHNRATCPRR
ncbi:hypothetical protein PLESTF_001395100 [Pleodorina starrii]|nr:hypothetical protein PLESTF_001395100 [Pleodorina starrii]